MKAVIWSHLNQATEPMRFYRPRLEIYHNFVRPHEGLDGATPAEKAGIKVDGENRWITLIQKAAEQKVRGKV